jgi:hypothetical protein
LAFGNEIAVFKMHAFQKTLGPRRMSISSIAFMVPVNDRYSVTFCTSGLLTVTSGAGGSTYSLFSPQPLKTPEMRTVNKRMVARFNCRQKLEGGIFTPLCKEENYLAQVYIDRICALFFSIWPN